MLFVDMIVELATWRHLICLNQNLPARCGRYTLLVREVVGFGELVSSCIGGRRGGVRDFAFFL